MFNQRFSLRINQFDTISNFDIIQNRLQNKVQKVSNRLNDIVSKLKEIQEELRRRQLITDFICKHFNRDGFQFDTNFLEIFTKYPQLLKLYLKNQKKIFIKREKACFWITKETLQTLRYWCYNSEGKYIDNRG